MGKRAVYNIAGQALIIGDKEEIPTGFASDIEDLKPKAPVVKKATKKKAAKKKAK